MPVIETKGAASSQGFGEFSKTAVANWIEDCFSCFLYTGNGSTQTITNGIDLSTYGGLVWGKRRDTASDHVLVDTARGATKNLSSNATYAEAIVAQGLTAFTSSGFTVGSSNGLNSNGSTLVSWTFRKQPKFFDVVTYTGDGTGQRDILHNLATTPKFLIYKCTSTASDWRVIAEVGGIAQEFSLNATTAGSSTGLPIQGWYATNTTFRVGSTFVTGGYNTNGQTYVAYLFAHNAGGFGLTGTDNVISCGSFTTVSNFASINLGYEPQWVLTKKTSAGSDWQIFDNMRGMGANTSGEFALLPNSSSAELENNVTQINATGFVNKQSDGTYIYIAIRRGPMRVPTDPTKVFAPIAKTGDGSTSTVTNVGFPADLFMFKWRGNAYGWKQQDRLRGFQQALASDQTGPEYNSGTYTFGTVNNTGYTYGSDASINAGELNYSGVTSGVFALRRAPGFFDEVCYTGNGTYNPRNHNLTVTPDLVITKSRSATGVWDTAVNAVGLGQAIGSLQLNSSGTGSNQQWAPWSSYFTSTTFTPTVDTNGVTYVAYLFASCPGVSKVGSYTGNGSTQTINCGFTGGARFVLIKRTDASGDWYVYDTARGMTTLTDPYLLLNSTAAESATLGSVTTVSTGFALNASILAAINTNGASYIFLAIS